MKKIRGKWFEKSCKMSSFKSNEKFQKKEDEPDRYDSTNQLSSVTLHELAMESKRKAMTRN